MSTKQLPIGSGFSAASTADEVIAGRDLSGKVAIITGGYSGIGLETARVLAAAGAQVIVPARDMEKARSTASGLAGVTLDSLDLMDPASINAFAARFLATGQALHLLINNAGVMASPLSRDTRGYESQFSTNHLGHFQLTAKLWPALKQAQGARVLSLSSGGHIIAGVDFDDPHFERRAYEPWTAYGQSKTANILFAVELDRRGKSHGVRAFSIHPGSIMTNLARHISAEQIRAFGVLDDEDRPIIDPATGKKTVEQGAATSVWCATSPALGGMGGVYCEDCDIARLATPEPSQPMGIQPRAVDPSEAQRLWQMSVTLTGCIF
ncbi:MAG: oxidoreductase [Rhodospirillales bacterium]|nr:oxidoreductase [Rhodospirillales bacterium]